jgi:hypothetical protein
MQENASYLVEVMHEFEAGWSPTALVVIGKHVSEADFNAAAEEAWEELRDSRLDGWSWEPDGDLRHVHWRAMWWDEEGDEHYGTEAEAREGSDGEPFCWDACPAGTPGSTPVTELPLAWTRTEVAADA